MDEFNMIYRLKEGFGTPDQYLGVNFEKVQLKERYTELRYLVLHGGKIA